MQTEDKNGGGLGTRLVGSGVTVLETTLNILVSEVNIASDKCVTDKINLQCP